MALVDGVLATAANFNAAFASKDFTFSRVVGSGIGVDVATLQEAIDASSAGDKILIASNLDVDTTIVIDKANIEICALPGVTVADDGAGTGISIEAAGVRIKGIRFSGFTTAISIADTFNFNFVTECRFASCTAEVTEVSATPNNVIFGNITE